MNGEDLKALAKRLTDASKWPGDHFNLVREVDAVAEALERLSPASAPIPQEDLTADAAKVLRENAWHLYDGDAQPISFSDPQKAKIRALMVATWQACWDYVVDCEAQGGRDDVRRDEDIDRLLAQEVP